jgi:hypothetical protein
MFRDKLLFLGACHEAVAWVGDRDAATAWAESQRGDWMLWLIRRVGGVEHKTLVALRNVEVIR